MMYDKAKMRNKLIFWVWGCLNQKSQTSHLLLWPTTFGHVSTDDILCLLVASLWQHTDVRDRHTNDTASVGSQQSNETYSVNYCSSNTDSVLRLWNFIVRKMNLQTNHTEHMSQCYLFALCAQIIPFLFQERTVWVKWQGRYRYWN